MQKNEALLKKIQASKIDVEQMNRLIEEYTPFIIKTISGVEKKYIDQNNDDRLTDAMMAFKEAVEKYDTSKGNFLSFASMVIKRRAIDQMRKEKTYDKNTVTIETHESKVTSISIEKHKEKILIEERQREISEYNKLLEDINICFKDLVKYSPKKKVLRDLYIQIGSYIASDEMLLEKTLSMGRLPIVEILSRFNVNRKKVERGRIYILAIVVLKHSDLRLIKDYIEMR